jgi:hemoglobin
VKSLFEKYGGMEVLSPIVLDFYDRVLRSAQVAHFFEGVDMDALVAHQVNFFAVAMDGPKLYNGRTMAEAHRGLGITQADFNEVAAILADTLEDNGVVDDDVQIILGRVAQLSSVIVVGGPEAAADSP